MKRSIFLILIFLPIILNAQDIFIKKKKGNYYFYTYLKKLNPKPYEKIEKSYINNYYAVKSDKWGLVDSLGQEVIECKYDTIIHSFNDCFIVELDDRKGVINGKEEIILEIKYQDIDYFIKDSVALVKLDEKWGLWEAGQVSYQPEKIIFGSPEIMPKYIDCKDKLVKDDEYYTSCDEQALLNDLYEKINYPKEALKKGISGLVVVSFVVTETGEITDLTVRREIGGGCGEEALRVVRNMHNWIPGEQDGIKVKTAYNLPVRFALK